MTPIPHVLRPSFALEPLPFPRLLSRSLLQPNSQMDALTNELRPLTDVFLTVRIIKSFTYRTTKNLLLPHLDATTTTVGQLKDLCRERESCMSL